jgi:hypothetical protein
LQFWFSRSLLSPEKVVSTQRRGDKEEDVLLGGKLNNFSQSSLRLRVKTFFWVIETSLYGSSRVVPEDNYIGFVASPLIIQAAKGGDIFGLRNFVIVLY